MVAKSFIHDLWGEAVNMASRMESHGDRGAFTSHVALTS
ncbi:MAG: hypothetical protein JO227_11865 [Acetobacteraceae bacterium]|nr:hypothetical protein [Acetobacteraceae bacterium]